MEEIEEYLSSGNNGSGGTYLCADRGLLLPVLDERSWGVPVRATLYFCGLLYIFFGIAIAADVFMCAIERITSEKKIVKVSRDDAELEESDAWQRGGETQTREVYVWNPTVANLTLMALGSSAPEILLSLIETVGRDFAAGPLGPSTIVGSAAFNLLIITAVCIVAVPNAADRRIAQLPVFIITSAFSIAAYIWLFVIIKVISPSRVEIWEAVVTLLLFPVLVIVAYSADKQFCCAMFHLPRLPSAQANDGAPAKAADCDAGPSAPQTQITQVHKGPKKVFGDDLAIAEAANRRRGGSHGLRYLDIGKEVAQQNPNADARLLALLTARRLDSRATHNRMYYRIIATRRLAACAAKTTESDGAGKSRKVAPVSAGDSRPGTTASHRSQVSIDQGRQSIIEFSGDRYSVSENETHVKLKVMRSGRMNRRVLFTYETIDGTAKGGKDYVSQQETLVFNPAEADKTIAVQILSDKHREPDETFYVKLSMEDLADSRTAVGQNNLAAVTIVDASTKEAKVQMAATAVAVRESVGSVQRRGAMGERAVVAWRTQDGTAIDGADYFGGGGQLVFEPAEVEKHIDIEIIDDKELEKHEWFAVELLDEGAEGAAVSGKKGRCVVTILNDDATTELLTRSDRLVAGQLDALQPTALTWPQQFIRAANVNGGDVDSASPKDYALHAVTFFWKLLLAFVPPARLAGGWLTFAVALAVIGALTALAGDLAAIFGCLVGLDDTITAITFVAVGTSLPDLFASRLAAMRERTADAAIGNVMGSNSVNVFLGLGTSWLAAAVVARARRRSFVIPAASLAFTVALYTLCAIFCVALLLARRSLALFGRAELGGRVVPKLVCAFVLVLLWIAFVALTQAKIAGVLPGF